MNIHSAITAINSDASVLRTQRSAVDLSLILNRGTFNAATGRGRHNHLDGLLLRPGLPSTQAVQSRSSTVSPEAVGGERDQDLADGQVLKQDPRKPSHASDMNGHSAQLAGKGAQLGQSHSHDGEHPLPHAHASGFASVTLRLSQPIDLSRLATRQDVVLGLQQGLLPAAQGDTAMSCIFIAGHGLLGCSTCTL